MRIQNPAGGEIDKIDRLISGVFMSNTPGESMAEWFSTLICEENKEHINCIYNDDTPVAVVNWYSSSIKCKDAVITAGSIGAVCCDEKERGKGYADILLKHTLAQMKEEGIAISLISGERGLYLRNGAFITGREYKFSFSQKEYSGRVRHIPHDKMYEYANIVYKFQSRLENRFIRSFEHTKKLLKGFGNSHHGCVCELYYTDDAYVIADINKGDSKANSYIVEYGGDGVMEILKHISYETGRTLVGRIEYSNEKMLSQIENKEECKMSGTIKIINPGLLFEQLSCSMERAGISMPDISEKNGEYTITTNTDKYVFSSEGLHRMIFEGADVPLEFENVFPLNMPKIDGMDYI